MVTALSILSRWIDKCICAFVNASTAPNMEEEQWVRWCRGRVRRRHLHVVTFSLCTLLFGLFCESPTRMVDRSSPSMRKRWKIGSCLSIYNPLVLPKSSLDQSSKRVLSDPASAKCSSLQLKTSCLCGYLSEFMSWSTFGWHNFTDLLELFCLFRSCHRQDGSSSYPAS